MEMSPLAAVLQDPVVLALAAALLPLASFVLSWLVGRRRPAGAAAVVFMKLRRSVCSPALTTTWGECPSIRARWPIQ